MRILLVEDEDKLAKSIAKGLLSENYTVDIASDYDVALALLDNSGYDIAILDRGLPLGHDGLEILRHIRQVQKSSMPVLVLSARSSIGDKVAGLSEGADDYLAKPFAFDELIARLQSLSRRIGHIQQDNIECGNMLIDRTTHKVTIKKRQLDLSKTEFRLLEYLALHPGQAIDKQTLIDNVWPDEADILPNTVEVSIRNVRKKIDIGRKSSRIGTQRGFGYYLEVE
jgi:DNA-binding response OmpR family regulator